MFRKYPYWGWLLLSIILWCINGYNFHLHRQDMLPERMARAVNADLKHREDVFEGFKLEHDILRRMYSDSLTGKEEDRINNFPFYIYCYDSGTLKFWNTSIIVPQYSDSALGKRVILQNDKGVFIAECIQPAGMDEHKRILALFPILITYPLENDYLKSHFVASDYIPVKTKIINADDQEAGTYPVIMRGNKTVFYLRFNSADVQKWVPDPLFLIMLIAAMLISISWVQLMIIHLTRNFAPIAGFIITLALVIAFRVFLYVYGLPFNLDTLTFFSPGLYASSKYLSSFGDLFIDTLCVLWVIVFVTRHTNYKNYFARFKKERSCYSIVVLLIFVLLAYVYLFVNIIRGLILDSSISFDVSHFYAINSYTILGLLVIGTITGITCLIVYLFNVQFNALIKKRKVKFLLIGLMGAALIIIVGKIHDPFYWGLYLWLLLYIWLLDIPGFALVSDLFEPRMVFWAIFICAFSSGVVEYFNHVKEKEARRAYVELKFSPHPDNVMEYDFDNKAKSIEHDKVLKSFFSKPSAVARKAVNQRFNTIYFTGAVNKYQCKAYLFDTKDNGLFNKDSVNYASLIKEKNESAPTGSPYLFYKESIHDRHFYYALIPIYNDTTNRKIGYVIIDIDMKKQPIESAVYPELLQTTTNKINPQENEYSVAVYVNDKLISQTNDYPFTTTLRDDILKDQDFAFYNNNRVSELHYKIAPDRTIVVAYEHSFLIEMITVFSYIFVIQILIAIAILLYQLYLSYFTNAADSGKFLRLTLQKRVHYSMLSIVLLSFIIIGSVTIWFFSTQYRTSSANILQSKMQVAKQSVEQELKIAEAYASQRAFDSVCRSGWFKDNITKIANAQKIDINVFENQGDLISSSQEDIYDKDLVSRKMHPEAFYQLNTLGRSIQIENEQVAGLSYLSAYQPLLEEHGTTLGYINVPFFSSEKDLNYQVSNIVVTLINLYAFIFLVSSVITVFMTGWITRTLNMIIGQFSTINLQRNERIQWPYDDEIGLLITEYNKMVNKVEENAALLAQSERESAWREMARQVAHEIKNPLTPMKLNIQYLQQAMRKDVPNIKELTDKAADSIIEQIDNLSYIASEFSNFAKMPEARPEKLELGALLNKAVELYRNDLHIKFTIIERSETLYVYSDRSQLLRVFTNLLENAKQSIPSGSQGNVLVTLKTENNTVTIAIADNGTGISEEVVKKLFQPYFTTKSSGTGLGLAMTKKIIEFWKGEIWFETKEGIGSTFYIKLPLIETEL